MKSKVCALILMLCLLGFATASSQSAGNNGPSASGEFRVSIDGLARNIEFNARADKNGGARGEMTFTGAFDGAGQDAEGVENAVATDSVSDISITAQFDCLVVNGNRAAMSGNVTGSTISGYIGQRILLVVEDNGEGVKTQEPDRLTWGFYRSSEQEWIPADAELDGDTGASLTWIAKDAERDEDVGIPSRKSAITSCQSFPLSTYSFIDVNHGNGNIQVRP